MQVFTECPAAHRIDVKRACNQLKVEIAQRRRTVDIADLATLAAAYHCPADRLVNILFSVDHCKRSFSVS